MIFGDYAGDELLAAALDLPRPGPGEFVSARLGRRASGHDPYARSIRLEGADWLLASAGDPAGRRPRSPASLVARLLGWQLLRWQGTGRRRW